MVLSMLLLAIKQNIVDGLKIKDKTFVKNKLLLISAWYQTVYCWNFRNNVHKVLNIFQNIEAPFMLMSASNEQLVSGKRIKTTGREIRL